MRNGSNNGTNHNVRVPAAHVAISAQDSPIGVIWRTGAMPVRSTRKRDGCRHAVSLGQASMAEDLLSTLPVMANVLADVGLGADLLSIVDGIDVEQEFWGSSNDPRGDIVYFPHVSQPS